jgi:hypothetical protein
VDPRVGRYFGIGVIAVMAAAGGVAQLLTSGPGNPTVQCAPGRSGAVGIALRQPLQRDQGNRVAVAVKACAGSGVFALGLLIGTPPPDAQPAAPSDIDVSTPGDCSRGRTDDQRVLLECGRLDAGQTRRIDLSLTPRSDSASVAKINVTAVDVGRGDHRVLDAVVVDAGIGIPPSGFPMWVQAIIAVAAVLIGIDMARRSRSGFLWVLGVGIFNVFAVMRWIAERTRWQVVPAGTPPLRQESPGWVRRYLIAIPMLPVALAVVALVGSAGGAFGAPGHGSSIRAEPLPTPLATPPPTPCAGGVLPAAVARATHIVVLCSGDPTATVVLHAGDTLGLVLPSGESGAGVELRVGPSDLSPLVDTQLGTPSAALLLARYSGNAVIELRSVCAPLDDTCGRVLLPSLRVTVER